jgi:aminoglycoside phosphotransferase family enzyme
VFLGFAEFGGTAFHSSTVRQLTDSARVELGRRAELLDRRRDAGAVRQCHGDLHPRNIVLLDGEPTLSMASSSTMRFRVST